MIERKIGRIHKSLSGFYEIVSEGDRYISRAKGLFRHQKIKPLVGDWVTFEIDFDHMDSDQRLVEVHDRKNHLLRPPIANVDAALVVTSMLEPNFSYNLLNNYLVALEMADIEPIIILTKLDLLEDDPSPEFLDWKQIQASYQKIGYPVFTVNPNQDLGEDVMTVFEEDKTYVVMGQSGAGKSTLLNRLLPEAKIETGSISQSLNRGRHTTRQVALYPYQGALLADTPGFSSLDLTHIDKYKLQMAYPEIYQARIGCKFSSCLHINEPKCQVKDLVHQGMIDASRYQHYVDLYHQIDTKKPKY